MVRIVAISDTHNQHDALDVPDGDVLVHAGDMSGHGHLRELEAFAAWCEAQPHRHKVVIAGNHDFCFERAEECAQARQLLSSVHYLEDAAVEVAGLTFYGSPWQPRFFDWAFNLQRGAALREKWARIPEDTDVLITHGPPRNRRDATHAGEPVGCDDLAARVAEVKPRLHVFGHIHEAYGVERDESTIFANASSCTLSYKPTNPPLVFDL